MKLWKIILTCTIVIVILILIVSSLPVSTARADTLGPNNPTSVSDVAGIGSVSWIDPGNVSQPGSPYASAILVGRVTTHYLQGTGYGFGVPSDATIRGIELQINRQVIEHNAGLQDNIVSLVKDGSIVGENKAITTTTWSTSFLQVTYGGPTDLWDTSWTPADVNDPDFGAVLSVNRMNNGSNNRTAVVDSLQIMVYYAYDSAMTLACGDGSPVEYGDEVTCTATVTRSTGSETPDGLVSWTSDGNGAFDPTSCELAGDGGVATCAVTYTATAVGTGAHMITASYDGGQHFIPENASQTVTVDQRPLTVIADPETKVYGSPDPEFTYTYTPTLVFSDAFTGTLSREPGEDVGSYAITQGTLAVNDNYDLTYTSNYLEITPAEAVCVVEPYSVTYDVLEHTATGSCVDLAGEILEGLDLTQTIHTDAGIYTDTWLFIDLTGNYADQTGNIVDTINKAEADCTVNPYDLPYDGKAHTATGSCTGVLNEELTGLDLSGTTHTNAGIYSDNWTFSNANYNDQAGAVDDMISKVDPRCTIDGWTGEYDGEPHGASGSCLDVDGLPLEGLDLGDLFTDVPGGTVQWAFTDVTGNYNDLGGTVEVAIVKADAKCTVTPYSVEFDKQAHTATGSCKGVKDEDLSGLDLSGTTHTEVGVYPGDSWTFTDVTGNYNGATGTVDDEITKILITVTADPKVKAFGKPDPQLTYTVTSGSLLEGDSFSGTLTRQPGEKPDTYAILQGTLSLPDYYEVTYVGADFTIFGIYYLPVMHKN